MDQVEVYQNGGRSPLVFTTGWKGTQGDGKGISVATVGRVARVYPAGELSVSKVMVNSSAKPPSPTYGRRYVAGVSRNGARIIRRSVMARAQAEQSQFVLLTLTSQAVRSDLEIKRRFDNFLKWCRKHFPDTFRWYIWVAELQARGVLHFHVVVARRIPKPQFLRLREMWAKVYGMGGGSVDVKKMRSSKGTAKYLAKYVVKRPVDDAPRVSRHNGQVYVRNLFAGNAYGLSGAARWGTQPSVEIFGAWGAFPGLDGWHGASEFFDSQEEATERLAQVLALDQGALPA